MTEEEKSNFLSVAQERFRHVEAQFTEELKGLQDKMLTDITQDGAAPLCSAIMAVRLGLAGVAGRHAKKLDSMRAVLSFMEQTDASLLTLDAIKEKIKFAKIGKIGLLDSLK